MEDLYIIEDTSTEAYLSNIGEEGPVWNTCMEEFGILLLEDRDAKELLKTKFSNNPNIIMRKFEPNDIDIFSFSC